MDNLPAWVESVFDYWSSEGPPTTVPGLRGLSAVRDIFARVATTRPLLSARILDEEVQRITLTDRQAIILDHLSRQRRVMIGGGAGRSEERRVGNEGGSTGRFSGAATHSKKK